MNKNMAIIKNLDNTDNQFVNEIYNNFTNQSGKVPEWVKVMAYCPDILKNFVNLFDSIMKQGEIETKLKWKIAYTVSQTLKCEFCLDVTKKMLLKMGGSDNIDFENNTEEEEEILGLVRAVTEKGYLTDVEKMYKICEGLGEAKAVEIVSVIGLFNYINRFNNMFVVLPE